MALNRDYRCFRADLGCYREGKRDDPQKETSAAMKIADLGANERIIFVGCPSEEMRGSKAKHYPFTVRAIPLIAHHSVA